ncbi:hypothetical protein KPH14_007327 [Odynerus spinipes]|uniref:Uncharacterized protein n=1 Tax=Odynerus spinipes TaxID=1348599 RepID=A0AAD9RA84_9HYME|nr:hypothetical protein KPH14_007327 [Odynerus spinipes]
MYKITYILIGILIIFSFYLQIHGDKIISKSNLRSIPQFKSNDFKDAQVTKFKNQISKNIAHKCELGRTCRDAEKKLNSNLKNNVAKYHNQIPIINLVPPMITTQDYYTYFNRRKKTLKHTNSEQDNSQRNIQNHRAKSGKKLVKNNPVEDSDQTSYIRDHAPAYLTEEKTKNQTKHESNHEETSPTNLSQISPNGDRVEFQIQGHEGPKTYIFGFDTGVGKNRQYRLEERLNDGTVKGHYGYYDARGKLRTVKYIAKPIEGYQEKHHETITHGDKN